MLSVLAMLLLTAAPAPSTKPRLAVTGLKAVGDVGEDFAAAMTEAISAEIGARGYFEPMTSSEIATVLGLDRQKQLLGCSEESSTCMAEVAAALGAPYAMSGSLTKIEGLYQLNLQVIDTQRTRTVARSTKLARDFEGLRSLIPYAVAEASGTPLPPAPSRVLPVTLLSAGGAALVTGAVFGILALNNEAVIRGELGTDDGNKTVVLAPTDSYRSRLAQTAAQRTGALALLVSGAVLVAMGIVLFPPDAPQPGVKVGLLPTLSGVAVAGFFP